MSQLLTTPLEWLQRLQNHFQNIQNNFQQEALKASQQKKLGKLSTPKPPSSTRKPKATPQVPASVKKSRRESLIMETPLKTKSPNLNSALNEETPVRTAYVEVPTTEGRLRRTAAIKANKYVDIVTRRLEQVPKNGATLKIFKTVNKLASKESSVLATPKAIANEPPKSALKSALKTRIQEQENIDLNSPSSINIAPASVTRFRFHDALASGPVITADNAPAETPSRRKTKPSATPRKQPAEVPKPPSTPIRLSESDSQLPTVEISPMKPIKETPATQKQRSQFSKRSLSPKKAEPIAAPSQPPATPKLPIANIPTDVEFVAPQSVLRSSKRPRKALELVSERSTPAAKKPQITATIPAIQVLKMAAASSTPLKPAVEAVPAAPSVPKSTTLPLKTADAVPSIIVPALSQLNSEANSSAEEVFPKRTPIRLKTPSRAKGALPSLADHKIAIIEVTPKAVSSTPKVEPWTSRFLKESTKPAAPVAAVPIVVKPVDTSKIAGFTAPVANVPVVPKFPLNLANISSVTRAMNIAKEVKKDPEAVPVPVAASTAPPPESPLSRAKRIDMENKAREDKLKSQMTNKADKLKQAINDLQSPDSEPEKTAKTEETTTKPSMHSSKLPVKTNILPSPKIPSRLAEAFSGIDAELPPIDVSLADEDKMLSRVLASNQTPAKATTTAKPAGSLPSATPTQQAQLHKTAVLNSASRKINPVDTTVVPSAAKPAATPKTIATTQATSSPYLPEIPSDDDELDKQKPGKENRPNWAMTPNLAVALNAQRTQRAEDIFGKVQPIKLEDFFKGNGKKYTHRTNM